MASSFFQVVADDLSGAAECAAMLARVGYADVPLLLHGVPPANGSWVFDTDSRAHPAATAGKLVALALRRAAAQRKPGAVLFKKIDSTLRGHLGPELRAALALPGLQAAVVCPALPAQGRAFVGGVLHVRGQPQEDIDSQPLDVVQMLTSVDPHPVLLRPPPDSLPQALAFDLLRAIKGGAKVIVVDASDASDLRRLARAIAIATRDARLLAVGAAGLAGALADELMGRGRQQPATCTPQAGRVLFVVGSFSPVTARQVEELGREPDVHLLRVPATAWLSETDRMADRLALAQARADTGQAVVLATTGAVPLQSTRELVERIAGAAEPLVRGARTLVLTGGDTARAVLARLGLERLYVLGELEPGICHSRADADALAIVTKAGGFGDDLSLVRVLRHFQPPNLTNVYEGRKQ